MRILAIFALCASFLGAVEIESASARAFAVGFKTESKLAVPMTFKDGNFTFAKTNGSVSEILSGAKASIDLASVDTDKNPVRDKNMREKLFGLFKTSVANGEILSVSGDEQKGSLSAKLEINGISKDVKMGYVVQNGAIRVFGAIDLLNDFELKAPFESFKSDKIIAGLHGKRTWEEVELGFEVRILKF